MFKSLRIFFIDSKSWLFQFCSTNGIIVTAARIAVVQKTWFHFLSSRIVFDLFAAVGGWHLGERVRLPFCHCGCCGVEFFSKTGLNLTLGSRKRLKKEVGARAKLSVTGYFEFSAGFH
jgi:hypothetical protein